MLRLSTKLPIVFGVLLSGCISNQPATLNALTVGNAPEDAAAILSYPLYGKTDNSRSPWSQRATAASGGKRIVRVGNYLLLKTMNAVDAKRTSESDWTATPQTVPKAGSLCPRLFA